MQWWKRQRNFEGNVMNIIEWTAFYKKNNIYNGFIWIYILNYNRVDFFGVPEETLNIKDELAIDKSEKEIFAEKATLATKWILADIAKMFLKWVFTAQAVMLLAGNILYAQNQNRTYFCSVLKQSKFLDLIDSDT